jgi:hypothetical protein
LGVTLPDWVMPRPPGPDDDTTAKFADLWTEHLADGSGRAVDYRLAAPRWQFLCWLADTQDVLLHGSGSADIEEFEPRQADDVGEFGARLAVYAASDGLWPMYFAIVDRTVVTSLVNGSMHVLDDDGRRTGSYYYFSVDRDALAAGAWRPGSVYVLPRETFEAQPEEVSDGLRLAGTQWASALPVRPLARIDVRPEDFPLLDEVHGHDPAVVVARAAADPDDFPWRDPPD